MLALRYGLQKLEREAPSTNRMCSKFKEANDFPRNGRKVTFMKWQMTFMKWQVTFMARKMTFMKIHEFDEQ